MFVLLTAHHQQEGGGGGADDYEGGGDPDGGRDARQKRRRRNDEEAEAANAGLEETRQQAAAEADAEMVPAVEEVRVKRFKLKLSEILKNEEKMSQEAVNTAMGAGAEKFTPEEIEFCLEKMQSDNKLMRMEEEDGSRVLFLI